MRHAHQGPAFTERLSRGGFTLLEVLLAIALSVIVLAAILAGTRIYADVTKQTEKDQSLVLISEGLASTLRSHLQTVSVPRLPEAVAVEEDSAEEEGDPGSLEDLTLMLQTDDTLLASASYGLQGDSVNLRYFHRGLSSDGSGYGLQLAEWFLVESPVTARQQRIADQLAADSPEGSLRGLVVLLGPARIIQALDEEGSDAELATYAQLVAPEVVAMQVLYLDGVDALAEWDTALTETIPLAIEISFTLMNDDGKEMLSSSLIRLPMADAAAIEDSLLGVEP